MKKTTLILGIFCLTMGLFSFTDLPREKAVIIETAKAMIKWESKSIEVGQIEYNKPFTIKFEFTNSGSEPLIITKVKPTCGCTVASYPKEPIAPGETKEIVAKYNAAAKGRFKKSITITSNAEVQTHVLYFSGEVK